MLENDAWFVWAAQIINFLILVALLRKFLYHRVLEVIASRQRDISARVAEAEQSRHEAEQLAASCREREQELDATRDKIHAEALQEVDAWKQAALEQARAEVEQAQSHWWDALHRDRDRFLKELRERAGRQVHQVARHVLTELADTNLEQQLLAVFLDRLKSLDEATRDRMAASRSKDSANTIASALPLSDKQQAEIRQCLQAQFGEVEPVRFEVDADLICGVELQMGDQRISWNVADTIEALERNFAAALDHGHESILAGNVSS
jgi:F-type H+-transporting ATPase subunit b